MPEFTTEEREALGYILDLAHEDQSHYIGMGDFTADYGDEWPEAAEIKANHFKTVASLLNKTGFFHGEPERWEALAKETLETLTPEYCECGRDWNDCATRAGADEHRNRS